MTVVMDNSAALTVVPFGAATGANMHSGSEAKWLYPGDGGFVVSEFVRRNPAATEIEVAVEAAAVNSIDVLRAGGYGRRALSLMGAARFPLVLGNDFAGTVTAVGSNVVEFRIGDRVFGAKPPSARGTHTSHVLVKAVHALHAPDGRDLAELSVLPYSFVTMWLAVRDAGLTRENAAGKRVLIHGAAGALGILATQMLAAWGARVTAMARPSRFEVCRNAGAAEVVDATTRPFGLGQIFDVSLNFATWNDDLALLGHLREGALGHATAVHPMARNFDELGWVRGGLSTLVEMNRHRSALPAGTRKYAWTVFRPHLAALQELSQLVNRDVVRLPIGLRLPLPDAAQSFDHVRQGKQGRAVLSP